MLSLLLLTQARNTIAEMQAESPDRIAGEDVREMAPSSVAKRRSNPQQSFWAGADRNFLERLATFRVVASTGHFTSAAVQLGYSQATVTVHIKALESQLGVTLFERCRFSRDIVLTEAGRRALEYAVRLLALAEETKMALKGAPHLDNNDTHLATSDANGQAS
jgi:DNA-binding transcriptional ArsR family regulator